MKEILINFGKQLKDLRISYKKTQREVAEYLGIAHQSYQEYETGTNFPRLENFILLCEFFELTPNELLGIE